MSQSEDAQHDRDVRDEDHTAPTPSFGWTSRPFPFPLRVIVGILLVGAELFLVLVGASYSFLFITPLAAMFAVLMGDVCCPTWGSVIDLEHNKVSRWDRMLGFLKRISELSLTDVAHIRVVSSLESGYGGGGLWGLLGLRRTPGSDMYLIVAESEYGEQVLLAEVAEASEALDCARELCSRLDVALLDCVFGDDRIIETRQAGVSYTEGLATKPVRASTPPLPASARGVYEQQLSGLIVHLPPGSIARRNLLCVAGLAVLFGAVGSLFYWFHRGVMPPLSYGAAAAVLFALLACCAMLKSWRLDTWLHVGPDEIVLERSRGSWHESRVIPSDVITDIAIVRNIGPIDTEGVWLGREALAITSDDTTIPFGMGMNSSELRWLKEQIDCILSGTNPKDVAVGTTSGHVGPSRVRQFTDTRTEQPTRILPIWGVSSGYHKSTRLNTGYALLWAAMVLLGVSGNLLL